MLPAVNSGLETCMTPAMNSRTPQAQNVNHLPMSHIRSVEPAESVCSTRTEAAGRTSRSRTTDIVYLFIIAPNQLLATRDPRSIAELGIGDDQARFTPYASVNAA